MTDREHVLSTDCWCQPRVDAFGDTAAPQDAGGALQLRGVYSCQRCGRVDHLDAVVPSETWALLTGGHILGPAGEVGDGGWNLLCLWCMDELAAEKGITCSVSLHFAGRALNGTSDSDANRAHVSRLVEERDAAREEAREAGEMVVQFVGREQELRSALAAAREEAANRHTLFLNSVDALREMGEQRFVAEAERDVAREEAANYKQAAEQQTEWGRAWQEEARLAFLWKGAATARATGLEALQAAVGVWRNQDENDPRGDTHLLARIIDAFDALAAPSLSAPAAVEGVGE